jgi:hypothetical protein
MRSLAFDLAKRDAVRVFCDRLREWLVGQRFSTSVNDNDLAYRAGWSDCLNHVISHISR